LKKLTILAALLAMLLTAFAPLVLAQQTPLSGVPADSGAIPTLDTPAPGSAVGCQNLYGYPTASCQVNEDGLITLPDGSTAHAFVQSNGTVFILDEETSILISIGTPVPSEDSVGDIQYDNAQG
jgi:hypothetical protein